jgi:hypothetical protein
MDVKIRRTRSVICKSSYGIKLKRLRRSSRGGNKEFIAHGIGTVHGKKINDFSNGLKNDQLGL